MEDQRVCTFCWAVVEPADAVCPACGLSDAQANAKLAPKFKSLPVPTEPEARGLASVPTDDLAKLVVARSSDISWLTSILGAVAFGSVLGLVGELAGPVVALVLFLLGGLAGFATGARAGQVIEAALLIIARDALRRGTVAAGVGGVPESLV